MSKSINRCLQGSRLWLADARGALALALLAALVGILGGCAAQTEEVKHVTTTSVPPAKPTPPAATTTVPMAGQRLQDLTVKEERGQTILLVKFALPLTSYRHFPIPNPSRIIVDIMADSKYQGSPDVYRLDTSIASTLRVSQLDGGLRLTTDIAAATVPGYSVSQEDGGIKIVIGAPNLSATGKKEVVLVSNGMRGDVRTASSATGKVSTTDKITGEKKEYTGQKISLEFKDADIKNVFRLLAEVSGKNIVVTDDVNRRVTVRLIEVPWDQAMELIIETNGLGKEETGNVTRISTAGRLKADKDALVAAKKSDENYEDLQTAYVTLNYAKVMKGPNDTNTDKDLVERAKALLSPRGKIEADQRTNTLIVRDIRKGIEDVQSLVARLDTRTPQILIESNLIETSPTFSRSIGSEIDGLFNKGRVDMSGRFLASNPFAGGLQGQAVPGVLTLPNSGFKWGYFGNNINAVLSAAEAEGKAKIISRPSIVTLNNIESTIESARIRRIITSAATVGEAGNIREIRAGITLKVTPQVSADGFVLLNIHVKSSSLNTGSVSAQGIPDEDTREAKANVLVRDGETVVIGGILKDTSSDSVAGVPYLKDVPVLGWIFKKWTLQKDFEELVVFITPRIIASGSENLPTADQIWRNQMNQTEGIVPPLTSLKP